MNHNTIIHPQKNTIDISLPTRLGWVSFFNDCSSEVIGRTLPLFLVTLGMSPTFIGLIEGLAETLAIFLKGFSGWLSDRMSSRKPLVILGYALAIFSRFALLLSYIPMVLALTRIFDRAGKGLRTAPRDAMIADAAASGKLGHAFGITRCLDTAGAVTGILVIVLLGIGQMPLDQSTFHELIYISVPFGLMALALLIFWIPRLPTQVKAKQYLSFKIPKKIRLYLAIVFIFTLGNSSDAFLVLRAQTLGLNLQQILLILVFFNILAATLAIPVGKLSDRYGRFPLLMTGWFIYGIVYIGIGLLNSVTWFVVLMMVYGAFYGFTEGVEKALLGDLLPAHERGTGYGALQLVLGLATLPASLLTGYLLSVYGAHIAFPAAGLLALISSALLAGWAYTHRL